MRKEKFSPKNLKISAGIPPEARKTLFWKRVLELLSAPSRAKCGVNISRVSANVKMAPPLWWWTRCWAQANACPSLL